jgi:protein TonB
VLQQTSLPDAPPPAERLRSRIGRRTIGISLALLIEALLLLALLSLGPTEQAGREQERITVVNIDLDDPPEDASEASSPEPEQKAASEPTPQQPAPEEPSQQAPPETLPQLPEPAAPPILPTPVPAPPQPPAPAATPSSAVGPKPVPRRSYGPPDSGGSSEYRDSVQVGTAPNGEPLYAAAWYREPRPDQLRAYLSTARGPGWGLIACRTAPDYRVEDCVALDEYPEGSQINRAVLAAAWEFKVRPPRLGGRTLVGSWVRIRIDYGYERR